MGRKTPGVQRRFVAQPVACPFAVHFRAGVYCGSFTMVSQKSSMELTIRTN